MGSIFERIEHSQAFPAKIFAVNLESSRLHWHFDYELMVVLKGSLHIHTGPEPYILSEGGIVLFNSKVIHGFKRTDTDNLCLFIQFSPALFERVLDHHRQYYFHLNSGSGKYPPKVPHGHFIKLAARIGLSGRQQGATPDLRTAALLQTLAADLVEYAEHDIRSGRPVDEIDSIGELVSKICIYIDSNLLSKNLATDILKEFRLSSKTLYRHLKTTTGMGLKDLANAARIEKSKELLRDTDKYAALVADECGFCNEVTFYRVFKKEVGITPKEFRMGGSSPLRAPKVRGYLNCDEQTVDTLLASYAAPPP